MLLVENSIHGLVLSPNRNAIQLEAHVELSSLHRGVKRSMENKANFGLTKNMYVSFVPAPIFGTSFLYKDAVTLIRTSIFPLDYQENLELTDENAWSLLS